MLAAVIFGLWSCSEDKALPRLDEVPAPSDISALFTIASDNSGEVTIQPNGRGVTQYTVFFGDGSDASAQLQPGESVTHVYPEGTYPVMIEAMGVNGEVTTFSQELMVSFRAPENLVVNIAPVPGDPFSIDVSATADLETFFEVTFGEDPEADPQPFMEGETVRHTYSATGSYPVRVIARSGGAATTEFTDTIEISNPLLLPIDFEADNQEYNFVNFGGATSTVVDNPDMSADNPSSRVGQLNKSEGSEVWAGSFLELGEPIDFTEFQQIRVRTWAPAAGITIMLKIENAANPDIFVEIPQENTVANGWEEMVYDFSEADLTQEYNRVVLFFDFGNNGTGANYYFDDIALTDGGPAVGLPLDFESDELTYTFTGFGGAGAGVIDNPDPSAPNTSNRVGEFVKSAGSETWAGAFIDMAEPIDFSLQQKIRLEVWSPETGVDIILKMENLADANVFVEDTVTTTAANQWETLEFDFTGIESSNDYQRIVLFFNWGVSGTGESYYFDNARLSDGTDPILLPIDFESETVPYAFTGFGDASAEVIDNPDPTGDNTSNRVAQFVKPQGAPSWAGVFLELSEPIDFSTTQQMSIKTWSPKAGATMLIKLENFDNADLFIEIPATTTTANAWETLTYDFSGIDPAVTYQRIVLFFDFEQAGTGEPYYFDDIQLAE
mgnify:FL=1